MVLYCSMALWGQLENPWRALHCCHIACMHELVIEAHPVLMRRVAGGEKSSRLNLVSRGVRCPSWPLLSLVRMRRLGLSLASEALASA